MKPVYLVFFISLSTFFQGFARESENNESIETKNSELSSKIVLGHTRADKSSLKVGLAVGYEYRFFRYLSGEIELGANTTHPEYKPEGGQISMERLWFFEAAFIPKLNWPIELNNLVLIPNIGVRLGYLASTTSPSNNFSFGFNSGLPIGIKFIFNETFGFSIQYTPLIFVRIENPLILFALSNDFALGFSYFF